MKYKWLTLLSITFFLFTSCQSVKDFLKIGENSKNTETETASSEQVASTVDEVLDRLPDAKTVAERLEILQEAYTLSLAEEKPDQTAYILQNLNADISSLTIAISPDYQQCEFGDSFNIMVFVDSTSGIPAGSVPIQVLLEDGTLFDSLETGPDGVFFGEFRCGIASGPGEKQYCFQLALDETAAKAVEGEIPHGDLLLMVKKMSVTAEVKVAEELFSDNLVSMYRSFLDQQLQLNLVVPNTKEKFHVQMEIFTSEMNHDYQGYSANISLAFYIAGNDGVVIYDMETDSCHAVGNSAAGVVESGVSKLFDAIKQDSSFISDFQNALFKE
ncbi:MAG: hypothetical protein IKN68_05960 [Spirochaetia bacterium]|nr:hypothetical protein [Spirochaetia bacterium]